MLDTLNQDNKAGAPFTLTVDTLVQATVVSPSNISDAHIVLQVDVGGGDFRNTTISNLSREGMQRLALQVGTYRWLFQPNRASNIATIHTTYDTPAA